MPNRSFLTPSLYHPSRSTIPRYQNPLLKHQTLSRDLSRSYLHVFLCFKSVLCGYVYVLEIPFSFSFFELFFAECRCELFLHGDHKDELFFTHVHSGSDQSFFWRCLRQSGFSSQTITDFESIFFMCSCISACMI